MTTAAPTAPVDLAAEAAIVIDRAAKQHDGGAVQRELMREALGIVATLKSAVEQSDSTRRQRHLVGQAGEALHEAWQSRPNGSRGFWLRYAWLCLRDLVPLMEAAPCPA